MGGWFPTGTAKWVGIKAEVDSIIDFEAITKVYAIPRNIICSHHVQFGAFPIFIQNDGLYCVQIYQGQ